MLTTRAVNYSEIVNATSIKNRCYITVIYRLSPHFDPEGLVWTHVERSDKCVSSNNRLLELSHNIANISISNDKRSSKCYLTEQELLEIIGKLRKPNPPSKHSLAREYDIDEKAIRKIWSKKDEIEQSSSLVTAEARASKFRHSNVAIYVA